MADSPPPMDFDDEEATPDTTQDATTQDTTETVEESQKEEPTPATLPTDIDDPLSTTTTPSATTEESSTAAPPILEPSTADDAEEETVQSEPPPPPANKTVDLFDDDEDEPPPTTSTSTDKQSVAVEQPVQPPPPEPEATKEEEEEEEEEEEGGDTFEMDIFIADPEKVGDGMGAYIAYNVTTKTSMPSFKSPETTVRRRFSDFLGLHSRLSERYLVKGRIVPPAPEKSVVGMTKVKFSKTEDAAFIERRRAALERYMNRLAKHISIRKDDIFRDFLENPAELPKASDTSAVSGAGFMRLVKSVGESISKMTGKKSDSDAWFEEQQQNYETLDNHLKKLHQSIETMITCRKDVCGSTSSFVKSVATLGNVEENDTVSRALARLSEVEEKVETLHTEQTQKDLYLFGETVKDYIALLGSIRNSFQMRVKLFNTWQSAQATLAKKRETEVKLQAGGKPEKIAQNKQEIKDWEGKVDEGQKNFDKATKTLKKEVQRFEEERAAEFKEKFIGYLESLMKMQEELIGLWEGFLPDAQAIV